MPLSTIFQLYHGGQFHRPTASHRQILSHNVVSNTPHHEWYSMALIYKRNHCI